MTGIATKVLRGYLLGGRLPARGCQRVWVKPARALHSSSQCRNQYLDTEKSSDIIPRNTNTLTPFRKQLKDEAKEAKKARGTGGKKEAVKETVPGWEMTIGIEIHAQLNTQRKLFSPSLSTHNAPPNTAVSYFDLAIPGSLPRFQTATLIPAIRAALALNCEIQRESRFDRKHYFHWDQPSGYQITQFYSPFAKDGHITLFAHDGIAAEDGKEVKVGIKQVQMEQDTAKTLTEPGEVHLLDFNRVGLPLIEIITTPCMHTPSTAAAFVRKVQILLSAVDACVLGMESGGLRADVNVSVRRTSETPQDEEHPLGTRTEIKNLSSFKSIHDAIVAERDRQIAVLEDGGTIAGETRGWTIGNTETKRLRGKEGEVDYRYMPDADIPPLFIGEDLINHLKTTMGTNPDAELISLTTEYGLTMKDALSLVALNDGGRAEYFYRVVDSLAALHPDDAASESPKRWGRMAGNWVLHELGGLGDSGPDFGEIAENPLRIDREGSCVVPAEKLAAIISHLEGKRISGKTAKALLQTIFRTHTDAADVDMKKTVDDVIEESDLWFHPLNEQGLKDLFKTVVVGNEAVVNDIINGKEGKVMFLVGQMMRKGESGQVDPKEAERVIRGAIAEAKAAMGKE